MLATLPELPASRRLLRQLPSTTEIMRPVTIPNIPPTAAAPYCLPSRIMLYSKFHQPLHNEASLASFIVLMNSQTSGPVPRIPAPSSEAKAKTTSRGRRQHALAPSAHTALEATSTAPTAPVERRADPDLNGGSVVAREDQSLGGGVEVVKVRLLKVGEAQV